VEIFQGGVLPYFIAHHPISYHSRRGRRQKRPTIAERTFVPL